MFFPLKSLHAAQVVQNMPAHVRNAMPVIWTGKTGVRRALGEMLIRDVINGESMVRSMSPVLVFLHKHIFI